MNALELLNRIQSVDIPGIASKVLQDHAEAIADLNASQLAQGRRADNSEILPSYRPLTVELKRGRPGLSGVTSYVTLFDTGAFYRGLYFDVKGLKIEYGSHDNKADALEKKYSKARGSIFGLTQENKEELIQGSIKPKFFNELRNKLNG